MLKAWRRAAVREGQSVAPGQVLLRMDAQDVQADGVTLATELALKSLQLRRVEGELNGSGLRRQPDDPADLYARGKRAANTQGLPLLARTG